MLEKGAFSAELLHRIPEMVLAPAELEECGKKFRAGICS